MQDLSYTFANARFELWTWHVDVMVYTFENAYSLNPSDIVIKRRADVEEIVCGSLLCAGGQTRAEGGARIIARKEGDSLHVSVNAWHKTKNIRCVKLTVRGLAPCVWLNKLDLTAPAVDERGMLAQYPEGWRTLDTPMLVLRHEDGRLTCLRSLDERVRNKRFFLRRGEGGVDAELIHEAYASDIGRSISVPTWELGAVESLEEAYQKQQRHIERAYGLKPWETREDVPAWAREISLVAAIHGQHWTGYIMNDYAKMQETLAWFARRIEGRRVLAFLPGWEGRYYWQYGDYRPCERMGGKKAFAKLCDAAREMGVHLMPMFGVNMVNRDLEGFEQWGAPSRAVSLSGESGRGSVDWDGSRHYDHGSNASLNPGAPMWQNRLVEQISDLASEYRFQAAFLDIAAVWYNDPHFPPTNEGVKRLCDRLRASTPDMLVCGEAWYDGLTPAMPVIHSGHTDGPMHYHDALYPPFFDTYMREFAHLCLGDAGRGSTGVHELGTNAVDWRVPLRKGLWQTATIVEDTLEKAGERVEEIIEDAKRYAALYLTEEKR